MAKKRRTKIQKRQVKMSAAEKARNFAAKFGVDLDESNILSVKADLKIVAGGKYKDTITGEEIGRVYVTQRTTGMYQRDYQAAKLITGNWNLTEEEFINNIGEYDELIAAKTEELKQESGLSGNALSQLIGSQIYGSE